MKWHDLYQARNPKNYIPAILKHSCNMAIFDPLNVEQIEHLPAMFDQNHPGATCDTSDSLRSDGAQDLMQKLEKEHEEKQVGDPGWSWDDLARAHQHLERSFCSRTTWVGKYRSSYKDAGTRQKRTWRSCHNCFLLGCHLFQTPCVACHVCIGWLGMSRNHGTLRSLNKTNLKVITGCNFVGEIAKDFNPLEDLTWNLKMMFFPAEKIFTFPSCRIPRPTMPKRWWQKRNGCKGSLSWGFQWQMKDWMVGISYNKQCMCHPWGAEPNWCENFGLPGFRCCQVLKNFNFDTSKHYFFGSSRSFCWFFFAEISARHSRRKEHQL